MFVSHHQYNKLLKERNELFDDCDQLARENNRLRGDLKRLEAQ